MSKVFGTYIFEHSILEGFVKAKIIDIYPQLISYFSFKDGGEELGRELYLDLITEINSYTFILNKKVSKSFNKKEFEEFFFKEIEKQFSNSLQGIRQHIIRENKQREEEIVALIEKNPLNRKLKRVPSFYEAKYMNLYYIYNYGIFQIVRIRKGFNAVSLFIQKPSGKYTEKTIPLDYFLQRELFFTKEKAERVLAQTSIGKELPKIRKEYVESLRKKYFLLIKE